MLSEETKQNETARKEEGKIRMSSGGMAGGLGFDDFDRRAYYDHITGMSIDWLHEEIFQNIRSVQDFIYLLDHAASDIVNNEGIDFRGVPVLCHNMSVCLEKAQIMKSKLYEHLYECLKKNVESQK